jgi:hypothetical protein
MLNKLLISKTLMEGNFDKKYTKMEWFSLINYIVLLTWDTSRCMINYSEL